MADRALVPAVAVAAVARRAGCRRQGQTRWLPSPPGTTPANNASGYHGIMAYSRLVFSPSFLLPHIVALRRVWGRVHDIVSRWRKLVVCAWCHVRAHARAHAWMRAPSTSDSGRQRTSNSSKPSRKAARIFRSELTTLPVLPRRAPLPDIVCRRCGGHNGRFAANFLVVGL